MTQNLVDATILARRSVRAFSNRAVDRATIEDMLRVARHAPSGTNTQPWRVYILQGASRDALVQKACALHDAMRDDPALAAQYPDEYDYYPPKWVSPYLERRRENGLSLYGVLGIGKGDKARMHQQHQRNLCFFGAPVGLMFTVDRVLGRGSLLDYGTFLQSFMLAARVRGLDCCPQAAWLSFSKIVMPHIGASEGEMLVCGMSMGYADADDVVNTMRTPRRDIAEFTTWLD